MKRTQTGAVTAETAFALPVLILLAAALAWVVAVAVTQIQVVDAARETARAVSRGEDDRTSQRYGERIAPQGARIRIARSGDEVFVTVSARVTGPGGVFGFLPGFEARGSTVAQVER